MSEERESAQGDRLDEIELEDIPGIEKSLLAYRILAWTVGVLLVVLTLVGVPLKYLWDDSTVVRLTGVPHGWLYAVLLISVVNLGMRVKWSWKWYVGIALAGTIPFLSFVAEHKATRFVRQRIADVQADREHPAEKPKA